MIWDKEASDGATHLKALRLRSALPMNAADRRLQRARQIRQMAWLTLCLLVAVTCLSAYLRHSAAGLGCAAWPACFGQGETAAAGAVVVGGQALTIARAAHRVTATLALLLVIAMLVVSAIRQPRLAREAALSLCLLVLALSLALLGVFTPGSRLPVVALGNLLGGFLMLALALRLAAPAPPSDRRLAFSASVATLLVLAQIGSGVLVSASQAGLACTSIRECIEQSSAAGWDWRALTPWREAGFAVGTPHAEGALAQLLHRLASVVVAVTVTCLGAAVLRRGRQGEGLALLLLLAVGVTLGLVSGSTGLPLVAVLLHNLAAAMLLALVLRLV